MVCHSLRGCAVISQLYQHFLGLWCFAVQINATPTKFLRADPNRVRSLVTMAMQRRAVDPLIENTKTFPCITVKLLNW